MLGRILVAPRDTRGSLSISIPAKRRDPINANETSASASRSTYTGLSEIVQKCCDTTNPGEAVLASRSVDPAPKPLTFGLERDDALLTSLRLRMFRPLTHGVSTTKQPHPIVRTSTYGRNLKLA